MKAFIVLSLAALQLLPCATDLSAQSAQRDSTNYVYSSSPDPDGIGKTFMGREIAQVMGHLGANWLERTEREAEEDPNALIEALKIQPGTRIGDIGAGTGYHSRRLARATGGEGRVYAVDIQPEMLKLVADRAIREGLTNIQTVLGSSTNVNLPKGELDLAIMVDVYHELEYPVEVVRSICDALRPGGLLVLVEFRAEDPKVPIKPLHKMSEAQIRRELDRHPLKWVRTDSVLPWQHIVVFEKRDGVPQNGS